MPVAPPPRRRTTAMMTFQDLMKLDPSHVKMLNEIHSLKREETNLYGEMMAILKSAPGGESVVRRRDEIQQRRASLEHDLQKRLQQS